MNALVKLEYQKPTFKPNPGQVPGNQLLHSGAPNVLLRGGSRSGKTFLIVRGLVKRAMRASGSRHAIWRQHFNHAKATIGRDTFPKVLALCFPTLVGKVEFSHEGVAMFPNGSEIWLAGLDDKERVEKVLGSEFATNFFNEISTMSWHAVEIAHSRLAQNIKVDRDGMFNPLPEDQRFTLPLVNWYDMNPGGKRHWSYQAFRLKLKPGTREPMPHPDDWVEMRLNPDDNRENLPEAYFRTLESMSAAKRRRFKEGEWANDVEGALWNDTMLDAARIDGFANRDDFEANVEELVRVVVGVDPSGAKGKDTTKVEPDAGRKANDIGIIVAGIGVSGQGYVLEDGTINAGPGEWGAHVVDLFDKWRADKVVAELNFGGAMVEFVLRTARATLPVKMVTSSRGKVLRAEPIAALYEPNQRKVKHAGYFGELEDQMAAMMPMPVGYTGDGSPDRLDASVFALSELMLGSSYTLANLD